MKKRTLKIFDEVISATRAVEAEDEIQGPHFVHRAPCKKPGAKKRWYTGPRGEGSRVGIEHREKVKRAKRLRDTYKLNAMVARVIWFMQPGLWYGRAEFIAGWPKADYWFGLSPAVKMGYVESILDPDRIGEVAMGYSGTRGAMPYVAKLYRLTPSGLAVKGQCLDIGQRGAWVWMGERWEKLDFLT